MIYCPHCNRPSAREQGACPHCGGALTGGKAPAAAPPARKAAPAPPPPPPPAPKAGPLLSDADFASIDEMGLPVQERAGAPAPADLGIDEMAFDHTILAGAAVKLPDAPAKKPSAPPAVRPKPQPAPEPERPSEPPATETPELLPGLMVGNQAYASKPPRSGLDVVSVEPPPPAPAPYPVDPYYAKSDPTARDPLASEVESFADFGAPEPGIVGTMKYWLRVRTRLKALAAEHQEAVASSRSAGDQRIAFQAEIGRKGQEIGRRNETVAPFVSKAKLADREISEAAQQLEALKSELEAKQKPLREQLRKVESEAEPLKEEERRMLAELKDLVGERHKVEGDLKRAESELTNIEGLIRQRQESYADLKRPKEERDRLLREITDLDKKRMPLLEQTRVLEEELAVRAKPIADSEARLGKVRGVLSEKLNIKTSLTAQIAALSKSLGEKSKAQSRRIAELTETAEQAWAAVGARIISEQFDDPDLVALKDTVVSVMQGAMEWERRVQVLAKAMESYDHEVVGKAKKYAAIGGAIAGVLFLILLYLLG